MKKFKKMRTHWIAMVFLGFSLLPSIPGNSQNPDKKQLADIAAIKQGGVDLDAAYNRRDAIAFSEIFLEDADFPPSIDRILKNAIITAKKWEAPTGGCSRGMLVAIGQRS